MKKLLALFLATAMTLSLVACGGGEAGSGASSSGAGEVRDTLVIGHYGDTPNFDTHDNLNDNGMRINLAIYDPLVRMNNETYVIEPCVAESWKISEDGKEYTFKIKSGIKFSDGTDMTIEDVVFSMERGIEMPLAVPSFARVVGVEAVGEDSVKLTLDGSYPEFLFAMALPTAGILSKAAFESMGEEAFANGPITTGPYVVADWKVGEKVTMVANEYYHMGEVPIKNVEYRVIADQNSAVISLEAGDIDAYVDVPQSSFGRISSSDDLTLYQGEAFSYYFIQLNTATAPFDNILARQAMAYATDKEAILNGIFDGDGQVVDTFATEEYLGYTDDVTKYPYDIQKAKDLFDQAGVVEGTEIDVIVYTTASSKVAQVLQNSLAEIGIVIKIEQMERSAFEDAALNSETQLIVNGSTFTAPTIDEATFSAIHSTQMDIRNYSNYSNADADRLLDAARASTDEAERAELYEEYLKLLSDEVPIIPTIWRTKNIAAHKDLQGITSNPWSFYNLYDFSWG